MRIIRIFVNWISLIIVIIASPVWTPLVLGYAILTVAMNDREPFETILKGERFFWQ
jgi:hypothetical protein